MKNKKILIVSSEFPPLPGGIGNHAYNLASYFCEKGYQIQVVTDQRANDNTDFIFDESQRFKIKRIALKRFRFLMYIQRVFMTANAIRKSNIVFATGKFSLWNVAFCSLFFNRETIAVLHGSEVNLKNGVLQYLTTKSLKRFNKLVAVSHFTKHFVSHLKKPVFVIPNGIDVAFWEKPTHGDILLSGKPVLTTVGRVSDRKGQLNVIKQLPELIKCFPNVHYHSIGIPSQAEAFTAIAKKLGVEKHVTFHGAVSSKQLKQALKATDIFVMLSSESVSGDVEGFGIAILEANAVGVPAIGSKGCGIEDAINTGATGFLIEPDNTLALKHAVEKLLENPEKFSSKARQWAKKHDWNSIIEQYEALLK